MNRLSKQLIRIANNISAEQIIEQQKQILEQYGFKVEQNQDGYSAQKTTPYVTATISYNKRRSSEANKIYPNISFKDFNSDACLKGLVNFSRITKPKLYNKMHQYCIQPYEDIVKQLQWWQDLFERLYNTN